MKVRTKLLLGYAGFVLALGVLGAWSARTLSQMSAVSGRIIAENYDSVVAAQDMKESLERQDSAALFDLLGQRDRARRQVAEHRARFDRAFDKAAANITETGEAQVVAAIRGGRDDYYRRFDAFLAASSDRTARYFGDLEPRFNAVRAECDRLLRLNQEAMRRKADAASQVARRWLFVTLALAIGLMAAGIAIEVSLSRAILGPVRQLTAATTRVAAGDLDAAVPVRSSDEIGALAAGFNSMAARIRELREADYQDVGRLKTEFIDAASRELRAPLTDVQMAIHLLLEGSAGPLSETQLDILQASRQSAARLDHLTRELLELSTLEGGATKSPRQLVRVSALVAAVVEPLRLKVEARSVRLVIDVPPDVPPVDVDRLQVNRVLTELVTNAAAATPAGGVITISATPIGDEVAVSVTDTGTGIARADLDRIFEPFVRTSGASGGPGLGLPIARRITESQGGRLTVESSEGHGTVFTLTLPRTIKARDI
jgi:signal transduction histidine kinase